MNDAAFETLTERARLGGYREYAPPAELRRIVGAVWSYVRPADAPAIPGPGHRLPVDSDISIAFATRRDARGRILDARLLLVGCLDTPIFFAPAAGDHLEAVRVHPEWCRDLFGIEPADLIDGQHPFDSPLLDRLVRSSTPLSVILDDLRRRSHDGELSREAGLANAALGHLRSAPRSTLSLDRIARRLAVSERHLRRIVQQRAGYGPKRLQRIARVQSAIASADRQPRPDWARIAGDCGFYDQPHMIQEFRSLAGCSPAELLRERRSETLAEISNPSG
jgi:AraC-like DNA-binding protein